MTTLARTEFPDFPELDVTLPEGFTDQSWKNEDCPSYINKAKDLILYINHPIPSEREHPTLPRFILIRLEDGKHVDEDPLLCTDHYEMVLSQIQATPPPTTP